MKRLVRSLVLYFCTLLSLFVSITGFVTITTLEQLAFHMAYLPVTVFLVYRCFRRVYPHKILGFYYFVITTILVAGGWLAVASQAQLFSALMFTPLALYFFVLLLPKRNHAIHLKAITTEPTRPLVATATKNFDFDRRAFLKLIGGAGVSLFVMTMFTRKADAAFFGSVPGPGTISIKDTAGNKIDPSEKHPTDGYNITELDDSSPGYYGFVNKTGQWFIMKEESSGAYRYTKGNSSFSTNWTGRAALTYDYFDNIF